MSLEYHIHKTGLLKEHKCDDHLELYWLEEGEIGSTYICGVCREEWILVQIKKGKKIFRQKKELLSLVGRL